MPHRRHAPQNATRNPRDGSTPSSSASGFATARATSRAHGLARVPEITVVFWMIKAMSTAMGESTSDYLVHAIPPVLAVGVGFIGFCAALWFQLSRRRYVATAYWTCVVMVGIFGTMAADVLHVGFHVPYLASSLLYGACLLGVFVAWKRSERTISIHTIDSLRREGFYWAAVVATFAAGTAVGDLTATTLHLGYLRSGLAFMALIALVAAVFVSSSVSAVAAFWAAYVLTRPLGASFADWVGKPRTIGGLGVGNGVVSLLLLGAIALAVNYLRRSKRDVQLTWSAPRPEPDRTTSAAS